MTYLKEKHILNHTNITISLAPIQDFDNNDSTDYCLTADSFRELQLQFILKYQLPLTSIYPSSKGCYCQADHYNSYCIDPHGDIYKCLSDIGIASRKISSIYDTNLCNYDLFDSYMLFDATTDEKCSNCKFLPICMGKCPFFRIKNRNICDYQKHSLEDYMIAYVRVSTSSK